MEELRLFGLSAPLAGHIRMAFGTDNPDRWVLAMLASGPEAAAAEDVSIGDVNGDGYLDVVAACELAHLIYFQNPGTNIRTQGWARVIPPAAMNRGSFIRVFIFRTWTAMAVRRSWRQTRDRRGQLIYVR